jgi:hypothetical protein
MKYLDLKRHLCLKLSKIRWGRGVRMRQIRQRMARYENSKEINENENEKDILYSSSIMFDFSV